MVKERNDDKREGIREQIYILKENNLLYMKNMYALYSKSKVFVQQSQEHQQLSE